MDAVPGDGGFAEVELEQVARDLARRIGDATVEVLPRCGHWMTAERAIECQSHLRKFFERSMATKT